MQKLDFIKTLDRIRSSVESGDKTYLPYSKKEIESFQEAENQDKIRQSILKAGLYALTKPKMLKDVKPKNNQQQVMISRLLKWDIMATFRLPYLYGTPGTGKSYIAMRLAYTLLTKGIENVSILSMSEFLIKYRQFDNNATFSAFSDPTVLIIDDFCAHNSTRVITEILHAGIDYRLRHKKPTMITSNIPANKISDFLFSSARRSEVSKSICDAIEDRIFELCLLSTFSFTSIRETEALARVTDNKPQLNREGD